MADSPPSHRSLGAMLRASCQAHASREALVALGGPSKGALTYAELYAAVRRWASAVRLLGLERGDRLCILAENSVEWALLDWACQTLGVVVVPLYPSLPADQIAYIVSDSGAKAAIAGDEALLAKCAGLPGVRAMPLRGAGGLEEAAAEAPRLSAEAWEAEIDLAEPEDAATIIYTSGTTGPPKGAVLAHRNFLWMAEAVRGNFGVDSSDVFLSFLPLSHVYERADGHFLPIALGAKIAYSRGVSSLAADFVLVRPTIFLCVPRLLEATMDRIADAAKKGSPLARRLFAGLLSSAARRRRGRAAPLYFALRRLVGGRIRERFGGRLRFAVSGGAALPAATAEFYEAIGMKVLQGYGLTETTGAVAVNSPLGENRPGTVGELLPGVEARLAEDGELLFRGPAIMSGYHGLPEASAAAIDADGWFHSGDVGEFEGGHLKITDRKKDILVLGNGKNVAPQPIENKLRASPVVAEAVLVGDGMDACAALIVPNFAALRARGLAGEDAELASSAEARAHVKAAIDATNRTLAPFEMVKRFALLDRPFSIETGELTPTLKVKRKAVVERYAAVIETLR